MLSNGKYSYIVRLGSNNGQKGYIDEDPVFLNSGNTITLGQDTATVYYQEKPYFTGDKIKILKPKFNFLNKRTAHFILTLLRKALVNFSWGDSFNVEVLRKIVIRLPIKNNNIDYQLIEDFISKLEAKRLAELEAYLKATGLSSYELTEPEKSAVENFNKLKWGMFNLEDLFGKSTRGKRLKSEDRIRGDLPFVTAGETEEGVSAFIGNDVEVFGKNTITIDMFGSAKYRNFEYGADDHVAVVHTEKLDPKAAIFVTSAIHKASHNGQFDYGRNFYAKDADALNVMLPQKDGAPDYEFMALLVSAIQKLVVKKVVLYVEENLDDSSH